MQAALALLAGLKFDVLPAGAEDASAAAEAQKGSPPLPWIHVIPGAKNFVPRFFVPKANTSHVIDLDLKPVGCARASEALNKQDALLAAQRSGTESDQKDNDDEFVSAVETSEEALRGSSKTLKQRL